MARCSSRRFRRRRTRRSCRWMASTASGAALRAIVARRDDRRRVERGQLRTTRPKVRVPMFKKGGMQSGRRCCRWSRPMLSMRSLLTFTLLLALVAPATAIRPCGDDVDGKGKHVACACGDLLVSSHVLGPADEVTTTACPSNGLLVAGTGTVTLDLDGRTIAGNGQGIGILVVRGSLLLVGPGSVAHFGIGLVATGTPELRSHVKVR